MNFVLQKNLLDLDFLIENAGGTVIRELRESPSESARTTRAPRISLLMQQALKPYGFSQLVKKAILRFIFGDSAHQINFRQSGEIHKWMYDQYSLRQLLNTVGFSTIKFVTPSESSIANWNSYGLDLKLDGSVHKPNSLFAEATK
jgi:hypothetical protein